MKFQIALVLLAGCSMFATEKKPTLIQQHADGTRTVALPNLPLQVRVRDSILQSPRDDAGVSRLYWDERNGRRQVIQIDAKPSAATSDDKVTELKTVHTGFSVGKVETFERGWDLYFSYLTPKLVKRIGYYSQVTVDGTTYRCFLEDGQEGLEAIQEGQRICRSAEKSAAPVASTGS